MVAGLSTAMVGTATDVNVTGIAVVPPGVVAVTVRVFGPTGTVTEQE